VFFQLLIPGLEMKENQGLKLSRSSLTPENDHLHIYSLWLDQVISLLASQ
jgi:hypothetical protein